MKKWLKKLNKINFNKIKKVWKNNKWLLSGLGIVVIATGLSVMGMALGGVFESSSKANHPPNIDEIDHNVIKDKTIADKDQSDVNSIKNSDLNLPPSDINKLPSKAGILKPKPKKYKNGATITFTSWTYDDVKGKINWAATETKGSAEPKKLSGSIVGFATRVKYDMGNANKEDVIKQIQKALNNKKTLVSKIMKNSTRKLSIKIGETTFELQLKIKRASKIKGIVEFFVSLINPTSIKLNPILKDLSIDGFIKERTSFDKVKSSRVKDGYEGVIFQAKNGDIYVMGKGTGLEVLKYGETEFKIALGSQIKNGGGGVIFQAENKDIYVMSDGSGLEVLKYGETKFKPALGSQIKNGEGGVIFQAENKDIYVMGYKSGLEVLKYGETKFKPAPGSEVENGYRGVIFQAKNKDIYVLTRKYFQVLNAGKKEFKSILSKYGANMGTQSGVIFQAKNKDIYVLAAGGLFVLKDGEGDFKKAPGSETKSGHEGVIFQAKNGDIYVMGHGSGLEVLKYGETEFKKAPGSKVTDGLGGTIFQAKNGDIYVMMAYSPGVQILKHNKNKFELPQSPTVSDGYKGVIFQAKNGDIFVMRQWKGLEVLEDKTEKFKKVKNSITKIGFGGVIFQAKNGDIYVMGKGTGLEVLKQWYIFS